MGQFSGPFRAEKILVKEKGWFGRTKTRHYWKVLEPFSYTTNDGKSVHVPQDFVTDLASVPRGLWNICPKDDVDSAASVVHDIAYRDRLYPQRDCDRIYLEAMRDCGQTLAKRRMKYRALRLFGWYSYNKNPKPGPKELLNVSNLS